MKRSCESSEAAASNKRSRCIDHEYVDTDLFHATCSICHDVFKRPTKLPSCGHPFCLPCIEEWRKCQPSCPECREAIPRNQKLIEDSGLSKMTDALVVRCLNHEMGCTWQGPRKDSHMHDNIDCPYTMVTCTLKDPITGVPCNHTCPRQKMHEHLKDCKFLLVTCPNGCGAIFTKENQTNHMEKCLSVYETCPNEGCGFFDERRNMGEHQKSCPHRIQTCRYEGCNHQVKLGDADWTWHNLTCAVEHAKGERAARISAEEEVRRLREENERMKVEQSNLLLTKKQEAQRSAMNQLSVSLSIALSHVHLQKHTHTGHDWPQYLAGGIYRGGL